MVEFKRPDLAYVEFLKASDMIVNLVPRHRDFPSIQDRAESSRQYRALMKVGYLTISAILGVLKEVVCRASAEYDGSDQIDDPRGQSLERRATKHIATRQSKPSLIETNLGFK